MSTAFILYCITMTTIILVMIIIITGFKAKTQTQLLLFAHDGTSSDITSHATCCVLEITVPRSGIRKRGKAQHLVIVK